MDAAHQSLKHLKINEKDQRESFRVSRHSQNKKLINMLLQAPLSVAWHA